MKHVAALVMCVLVCVYAGLEVASPLFGGGSFTDQNKPPRESLVLFIEIAQYELER